MIFKAHIIWVDTYFPHYRLIEIISENGNIALLPNNGYVDIGSFNTSTGSRGIQI